MTNIISYKNYSARIEYDAEDEIFFGRIAGISDGVSFHSDTARGIKTAFEEAVDDYLVTCEAIGKEPQKEYSGQVFFRVSPDVHRDAVISAALAGLSLNKWGEKVLINAIAELKQSPNKLA